MVVAAAVLLVVAIALGASLLRTRARVEALEGELEAVARARDAADGLRRSAEAETATARHERDDALEREKRARREAAEVAKRLAEEREARAAAEAALGEAEAAAADREDGDVGALWALALAASRRTWEVSVAPSPGMASPLDGAADPLRAAVEIEVDAAREEAGAAIDLEWDGDAVAPPSVALPTLSIVQELVARIAKASEEAVLRVTSEPDGITVEVEGTDAEGRSVVPDDVAAEHRVGPGRYVLRP